MGQAIGAEALIEGLAGLGSRLGWHIVSISILGLLLLIGERRGGGGGGCLDGKRRGQVPV